MSPLMPVFVILGSEGQQPSSDGEGCSSSHVGFGYMICFHTGPSLSHMPQEAEGAESEDK